MPLKGVVKYRVKTTKSGKKIRLAFDKKGQVLEATPLEKRAAKGKRLGYS